MVIRYPSRQAGRRGILMMEMLAATALLLIALLPIAYSTAHEKTLIRAYYQRAIAMEFADGELEVLLAGEWRAYTPGTHEFQPSGTAATNLPPGRWTLTIQTNQLRVEWVPAGRHHGGVVTRTADLP